MKIKRIVIEIEIEPSDNAAGHATTFEFMHGRWAMNGYCYNRILLTLGELWQLLRERIVHESNRKEAAEPPSDQTYTA